MHEAWNLYQERGAQALWDACLGWQDNTVEQSMLYQDRLLAEQLEWLQGSLYGRWVLRSARPTNYRELVEVMPLTEYEYYADTLGERREDLLAEKPHAWIRTSGRTSGKHRWLPLSERAFEAGKWPGIGLMLAAMADEPGQIRMRRGDHYLNMMAPPPYASGTMFRMIEEAWPVRLFPESTPQNDALPFDQRSARAFGQAVTEGIDFAVSLASVLAGIGEGFASRRPPGTVLDRLKNPRAMSRMIRAKLKARGAGRQLYPRDAWPHLRGVATGGMDSSLFRDRIREYWGRYPLEVLASTEAGITAAQGSDYTSLTLIPNLNFFEFVPEDELRREEEAPGYQPCTVLLDGIEAGKNYELVVTNLHGGPLVRYRTGDILRVTALSNTNTGSPQPQFAHYARRSDLLEVGAFVRLTESTVWRAIEEADVPYVDWTVRKEIDSGSPVVHIRLEPKVEGYVNESEAQARIDRSLGLIEPDWADMKEIAGLSPLKVTFLPSGAFGRYTERKIAEGADFAHLKPVHMNPPAVTVDALLASATEALTH